MQGRVKFYNDVRKFGFITKDDGSGTIFFHVSGLRNTDIVDKDDQVTFDIGQSNKGEIALNITKI